MTTTPFAPRTSIPDVERASSARRPGKLSQTAPARIPALTLATCEAAE